MKAASSRFWSGSSPFLFEKHQGHKTIYGGPSRPLRPCMALYYGLAWTSTAIRLKALKAQGRARTKLCQVLAGNDTATRAAFDQRSRARGRRWQREGDSGGLLALERLNLDLGSSGTPGALDGPALNRPLWRLRLAVDPPFGPNKQPRPLLSEHVVVIPTLKKYNALKSLIRPSGAS